MLRLVSAGVRQPVTGTARRVAPDCQGIYTAGRTASADTAPKASDLAHLHTSVCSHW